ncbi:MAG TPA: glycosyltransferase [Cyclobacteriaceae bacterium]|nr:glycosyltransferase [Cyclobacteriaceae bacterium]
MQNPDDILTVLVLFQSKLHEAPAFKSLSVARQGIGTRGQLFVYDNSPKRQEIASSEMWNIHYVHDPTNPGVSKAYNEANTYALELGMSWMLLADQDTNFPPHIYHQFRHALLDNPQCTIFAPTLIDDKGIVSPFVQQFHRGRRLKNVRAGKMRLHDTFVVNSGLIISVSSFRAAGGYDERLRLDFSDVNFFQKQKALASHFIVLDAVCRHSLSSSADTQLKDALNRFAIYLEGSRITGRAFGNAILLECYAILRAIRLSWQHRSLRFLSTLFSRAI